MLVRLLLIIGMCGAGIVHADDRLKDRPLPGAIRLLPGYVHEPLQGIDSVPGLIRSPNGLSISYEIGYVGRPGQPEVGGQFHDWPKKTPAEQRLWYKEQTINGQEVHLAQLKDQRLIVAYPRDGINFSVKVSTPEQLAEALLIILSYPPAPPAQPKK